MAGAHDLAARQGRLRLALTALLVAAHVLVMGALSLLIVSALVRGDATQPGLVAVAVALVAVATSTPYAQRWIRDGVAELVSAADSGDAAALVALRLGERQEPEAVLWTLASTMREILGVAGVEIVIRPSPAAALARHVGGGRWFDGHGVGVGWTTGSGVQLPLLYEGRDFGLVRILGSSRSSRRNEPFVDDVVRHVALVVSSSVLRDELEVSREGIVRAREEERRRIRRDLHDGLGPSLAAIKLEVGAARRRLEAGGHDASAMERLGGVVGDATEEVRRVIEELRPPLLDELGLVDALRSLRFVPDGLSLCVQASSPLDSLPAAVEVAAYKIASEAIRNVVRHAGATACDVAIRCGQDALELRVRDDGAGVRVSHPAGVGIASMHERAREVGGTISIERAEPCGTLVLAVLPCKGSDRS